MTIKLPKVKVTPQYLHTIAPYTNGQHHLTEALKGAADRIAELEQQLAALRAGRDALAGEDG